MMAGRHEAIEALTALLVEAQDRLIALNYGVRAEVALDDRSVLRFFKDGGRWGLFVVDRVYGTDEEDGAVTPIVEAPKLRRILAAGRLAALHGAMETAVREQEADTIRACETVRRFLGR